VHVLPGNQRVHLRLAGFRSGTVPALKLDGRRIQGSIPIAHELEALRPDPALYPPDPDARRQVEAAERWGDAEFQPFPRRIFRWALTRDPALRAWLVKQDGGMPAPELAARVTAPVSRYYAWVVGATKESVRRDVAQLPRMLDHVDELISDRVITTERPNAATLQVMCTVRSLLGFSDFEPLVACRSFAQLARELFPEFPPEPIPPFVERLGVG
jgi:glutathione S-transferase